MKKIYLIRHAESESNAGGIIEHNRLVKLSELGKQQAKDLVEILDKDENISKPDKIIVSKFIRTQETVEPLIKKLINQNHDMEVHLWLDTHEFDYLDRRNFLDKPKEEFDKFAKQYWLDADPYVRQLEERETFQEFADRVHGVILKLNKLEGVNFIVTHGHFIAMFGLLTKLYTAKKYEAEKQKDGFYKSLMLTLTDSYESGDYLQAKNTEVRDVSELVEKYCI